MISFRPAQILQQMFHTLGSLFSLKTSSEDHFLLVVGEMEVGYRPKDFRHLNNISNLVSDA